ncbi:hypothetical protein XELAEV_18033382mg [Xenopus laevis]|uniref:Uncharacterized protein n=1 Tax=Xenopus laevis TaxID=8355 RepID=A0A974CKP5_XENLA|nr:hypothetical protein XELAEV_18033382mg [Xenopus laevis]
MLHLHNWLSFYQQNYITIGILLTTVHVSVFKQRGNREQVDGRFYDESGNPTQTLEDALKVTDNGLNGGIQWDWVGVTRQMYTRCEEFWSSLKQPDSTKHSNRGDKSKRK